MLMSEYHEVNDDVLDAMAEMAQTASRAVAHYVFLLHEKMAVCQLFPMVLILPVD